MKARQGGLEEAELRAQPPFAHQRPLGIAPTLAAGILIAFVFPGLLAASLEQDLLTEGASTRRTRGWVRRAEGRCWEGREGAGRQL